MALALSGLAALGVCTIMNSAQTYGQAEQTAPAGSDNSATVTQNLPAWAYPPSATNQFAGLARAFGRGASGQGQGQGQGQAAADPGPVLHIPGSTVGFTARQVRNFYAIPDWFPDQHPPAPDMVLHGDKENGAWGCGYCHLPNGFGRTENQSIAGLPAAYIIEQTAEFKSGVRKTSGPRLGPVSTMVHEAESATDEDVKIAAAYFASVKPKPWIRVVETDTVPVTKVAGPIWVVAEGGAKEHLGDDRIVELAEDQERFELRDASSGFVAYVPMGSIERGKKLVTADSGGKTTPCTICHGADLKGLGNIPYLTGRSPSQLARQIIDIQNGNRNGPEAALMKPVVKNLTNKDIVDITAYLASLTP
jgi:cytochrome c553